MKKTAFLITALDFGGAEKILAALLPGLKARSGGEVIVISVYDEGRLGPELASSGVRRINLQGRLPGMLLRPAYFVSSLFKLRNILRSEGIGLVVSFLFEPAILARLAGRISGTGVKVLCSVRASRQSMNDLAEAAYVTAERLTSSLVYRYVFVSRAALSYLSARFPIPERKMTVIENGVDLEKFAFRTARSGGVAELLNAQSAKYFVGTVGRLCAHKGFECFLKAARNILLMREDIYFVIIGEGPLSRRLLRMIHSDRLSEHVTIHGFVPDVERIFRGLDVYLNTSLSEGMSNTLLEAMASGCPVVANDIPANRELLSDGENSLLVAKNDPVASSRAVLHMINDPALASRCALSARKLVERDYGLGLSVRKWSELLEKETA